MSKKETRKDETRAVRARDTTEENVLKLNEQARGRNEKSHYFLIKIIDTVDNIHEMKKLKVLWRAGREKWAANKGFGSHRHQIFLRRQLILNYTGPCRWKLELWTNILFSHISKVHRFR